MMFAILSEHLKRWYRFDHFFTRQGNFIGWHHLKTYVCITNHCKATLLSGPDLDEAGPGAILNLGPPGLDVDSLGPQANAVFTAILALFNMA